MTTEVDAKSAPAAAAAASPLAARNFAKATGVSGEYQCRFKTFIIFHPQSQVSDQSQLVPHLGTLAADERFRLRMIGPALLEKWDAGFEARSRLASNVPLQHYTDLIFRNLRLFFGSSDHKPSFYQDVAALVAGASHVDVSKTDGFADQRALLTDFLSSDAKDLFTALRLMPVSTSETGAAHSPIYTAIVIAAKSLFCIAHNDAAKAQQLLTTLLKRFAVFLPLD